MRFPQIYLQYDKIGFDISDSLSTNQIWNYKSQFTNEFKSILKLEPLFGNPDLVNWMTCAIELERTFGG